MAQQTIAQKLKITKFPFRIKDDNGNDIYYENSDGYWNKSKYDEKGNVIYYESSNGKVIDKRPKCENKVVDTPQVPLTHKTNNMAQQKLYTEEQVKECLDDYFSFGDRAIYYALSKMTPIELPSDEVIEILGSSGMQDAFNAGLKEGAKWMKEQILNQNK